MPATPCCYLAFQNVWYCRSHHEVETGCNCVLSSAFFVLLRTQRGVAFAFWLVVHRTESGCYDCSGLILVRMIVMLRNRKGRRKTNCLNDLWIKWLYRIILLYNYYIFLRRCFVKQLIVLGLTRKLAYVMMSAEKCLLSCISFSDVRSAEQSWANGSVGKGWYTEVK